MDLGMHIKRSPLQYLGSKSPLQVLNTPAICLYPTAHAAIDYKHLSPQRGHAVQYTNCFTVCTRQPTHFDLFEVDCGTKYAQYILYINAKGLVLYKRIYCLYLCLVGIGWIRRLENSKVAVT
jgi:hypothetical protein